MKTLFKLTLALAVVAVCGSTASAQKFGYINMAELVTLMPESDSASVKLQALQKELGDQLDAVQVEFNTKYQEYQKNQATYSEAVNQLKTKELNDLQNRYQELNYENILIASFGIKKNNSAFIADISGGVLTPIYDKAQKAVEKVSKDNGFTLVFNVTSDPLAYYNSATVTDVLPLVKKELNLKDKPAAEQTTAPAQ